MKDEKDSPGESRFIAIAHALVYSTGDFFCNRGLSFDIHKEHCNTQRALPFDNVTLL